MTLLLLGVEPGAIPDEESLSDSESLSQSVIPDDVRLLEDGEPRLLEDGNFRYLES